MRGATLVHIWVTHRGVELYMGICIHKRAWCVVDPEVFYFRNWTTLEHFGVANQGRHPTTCIYKRKPNNWLRVLVTQ